MFMALNHRLFLATGEAKYIDVLERGMYNNALSGVSTTGNRFFYVNRLASAGDGRDERWERASLECCPPNLVRFLATMPGYIYAQDKRDAVYVNLYVTSRAAFKVARNDAFPCGESDMPWGGRSVLTVTSNEPRRASIKLRVPGWARNQPSARSLYAYADALNTVEGLRGQRKGVRRARSVRLRHDRPCLEERRFDQIEFPMEVGRSLRTRA